jgi:hypothetical protein
MATKKSTKKKSGKTKSAPKRKPTKKAAPKKAARAGGATKSAALNKRVRGRSQTVGVVTFEPAGLGARSGGQSGDLQGLSNRGRASSESVDELLEEGNAFEAEVVKGVEDAADTDEAEVRTHEVPQDDVPEEYRDKD